MHGDTQNANESFNNIIWTKCPKNILVDKTTLEIGVYSAVLHFNFGPKGIYKVFSSFDILDGVFMMDSTEISTQCREKTANCKSSEKGKK